MKAFCRGLVKILEILMKRCQSMCYHEMTKSVNLYVLWSFFVCFYTNFLSPNVRHNFYMMLFINHFCITLRLEKKLVEAERKYKLIRWRRSDAEYVSYKLLHYNKRLDQLKNELIYSGREHKFLTNLKKKYAGKNHIYVLNPFTLFFVLHNNTSLSFLVYRWPGYFY